VAADKSAVEGKGRASARYFAKGKWSNILELPAVTEPAVSAAAAQFYRLAEMLDGYQLFSIQFKPVTPTCERTRPKCENGETTAAALTNTVRQSQQIKLTVDLHSALSPATHLYATRESVFSYLRTLTTWHCPHSPASRRCCRHAGPTAAAGLLLWAHAGTLSQILWIAKMSPRQCTVAR